MSQAIMDWGFPRIYILGKMKRAGKERKEVEEYRKSIMEEFDGRVDLSNPEDKVHINFFSTEMTRTRLRLVSSL